METLKRSVGRSGPVGADSSRMGRNLRTGNTRAGRAGIDHGQGASRGFRAGEMVSREESGDRWWRPRSIRFGNSAAELPRTECDRGTMKSQLHLNTTAIEWALDRNGV